MKRAGKTCLLSRRSLASGCIISKFTTFEHRSQTLPTNLEMLHPSVWSKSVQFIMLTGDALHMSVLLTRIHRFSFPTTMYKSLPWSRGYHVTWSGSLSTRRYPLSSEASSAPLAPVLSTRMSSSFEKGPQDRRADAHAWPSNHLDLSDHSVITQVTVVTL